ncbi:hypothetical protein AMATHDRAFT_6563 [Amanita thiersii Skay4041]|uniref:Uncharacterized protein n=1 Tax=Amanita thiersii Skay4041 TaxID=703135 RepID=A0A2A9NIR1_9AGAR|nr:hypothetical protein AMATHDRAFT_6563 [Amanita thiersii Skay4041]
MSVNIFGGLYLQAFSRRSIKTHESVDFSRPFTLVKAIYVFTRYSTLVFQIATAVFVSTTLNQIPVPEQACRAWVYSQQYAVIMTIFLLNTVLMLRVYALYGKSIKIGLILIFSLFAELVCGLTVSTLIGREYKVNDICLAKDKTPWLIIVSLAIIAQQLLIWGLTLRKWININTMSINATAQRVCHVVMRDGTWVLFCVFAVLVTIVPYAVFIDRITHIAFAISTPAYSSVTCRLVINMQRLHTESSPISHELTTFSITESP